MRMPRFLAMLPLAFFACGDNTGEQLSPDARQADAPPIDAPAVTCEFNEANDAGNDDLFGTGNPETTSLSFAATKVTFCGKIDNTHYDGTSQLIDSDAFAVHVTSDRGAKLYLTGSGVEALSTVLIEIYDDVSGTDAVGTFLGNHAAAGVELIAGDYLVRMTAFHSAAPTSPIGYRLTLVPADLATACPHVTTGGYTEGHDGITADGNDMLEVRYMNGRTLATTTANVADTPEDTSSAFTVAPNMNYRATGVNSSPAAPPVSWMDAYQDRETFAIKTGANTNELSLRLNWPGTTMDMDMFVFKENDDVPFANAYSNGNMEPEFLTISVEPNSTYWVWAGADNASTGQPINYDLTVCGATFTP
jgi:hypothetical protein